MESLPGEIREGFWEKVTFDDGLYGMDFTFWEKGIIKEIENHTSVVQAVMKYHRLV